jgi:polysaccharide pyruvyl transferase WcaK-like protein
MESLKKNIYIYGYYGCANVGDELLLQVILRRLLSRKNVGSVTVKCLSPPIDVVDTRIFYDTCENLLIRPSYAPFLRFIFFLSHLLRSFKNVDYFLFGGGTLFHAVNRSPLNLFIMLSVALVAKARGAKIYSLGVGVGQIEGWIARGLMSLILLLASDFAVRDQTSLANCSKLMVKNRARLTADLAFCLPIREVGVGRKLKSLGITLIASMASEFCAESKSSLRELQGAFEGLMKGGWKLGAMVFQHLTEEGARLSDSDVFDLVFQGWAGTSVQRLQPAADPQGLIKLFGTFDLVIGMRFHSLVISALCGIPFVGVGDDHKLRDICSAYGMPFIALSKLNAEDLVSAVNLAHGLKPNKSITRSMSISAARNFVAVEKCL